jgi:hypothetical protein
MNFWKPEALNNIRYFLANAALHRQFLSINITLAQNSRDNARRGRAMYWKQLAQIPEEKLAELDIGWVHHVCALGLPGAEEISLESVEGHSRSNRTTGRRIYRST